VLACQLLAAPALLASARRPCWAHLKAPASNTRRDRGSSARQRQSIDAADRWLEMIGVARDRLSGAQGIGLAVPAQLAVEGAESGHGSLARASRGRSAVP